MRDVVLTIALAVCVASFARAQDSVQQPDYVKDLFKENQDLKDRVKRLEATSLEEAVEDYLEDAPAYREAIDGDFSMPGVMKLKLFGELRVRGEVRDRIYTPADSDGSDSFNVVRMRTRLGFDLTVTEKITAILQFQDVRAWGQEQSTVGMLNAVDIKRAYMIFKDLGDEPIDLEVGRFVMWYGDQRIIGHLEWVEQGRTYDGVRARYHPQKWWLDLFAVTVNETLAANDDRWFAGFYGGMDLSGETAKLEGYVLVNSNDASLTGEVADGKTRYWVAGARAHGKSGAIDYSGEITWMGAGEVRGDDLSALGAAGIVGYTFEESSWKPRLGFEVAWASGDRDPTDGKQDALQTLYPTNHLYYGFIDSVGWSNILDFRAKLIVKPHEKWLASLDYHHFRLDRETGTWVHATGLPIRTGAAGAGTHLADEIDLTAKWSATKSFTLLIGYSIFLPGGFIESTGDDPIAQFFYIQGHLKF